MIATDNIERQAAPDLMETQVDLTRRTVGILTQVATLVLFATAVAAQNETVKEAVTSTLTAHKVIAGAHGKESFHAADEAKPGDVVEYRAVYRNTSNAAVMNLAATLPVPQGGFQYLGSTAQPAVFLASLDGKTFAQVPLKRTVTLPDGRKEERTVPESEYRSLRWNLGELSAGASVTVSARMKVTQ